MSNTYIRIDDQTIKGSAFKRLCHIAALDNNDDQLEAVIDGSIVTAMLYQDGPWRTWVDWQRALTEIYGFEFTEEELQGGIDRAIASARLGRSRVGEYVLSPRERDSAEAKIHDAEQLEQRVKDRWLSQVPEDLLNSSGPDTVWAVLQDYMAKAFREHGAETVALLTEQSSQPISMSIAQHLESAITDQASIGKDHDAIYLAVKKFFETLDPDRLKYVTQLLDGTVSFYALRIDPDTAQYLRGSLPRIDIFLDTNVIFGLLDIHINPMAGPTREAIRTIKQNNLPLKLYYHERTLKELENTVDGIGSRLRSRQWSQASSRGMLGFPQAYSGMEIRYHTLNAQSPTPVSVFLARYANLPELLKEYGCQIFRDPPDPGYTTREKGELIAEYQEYADKVRPGHRKNYNAFDHDIVVWLAAQRRRTGSGRAPLTSGSVMLSTDRMFYKFDRDFLARHRETSPSTVFPTSLMQVLRPFASTIPNFDSAFLHTFAAPEFRALSSEAEETVRAVFSYLAMFSDVSEETARRIIASSITMKKLQGLDRRSREFAEAIDQEIVDQNIDLMEERTALKKELDEEQRRAQEQLEALQQELQRQKSRLEELEKGQSSRDS